jgi:predicted lactoylglutathione lyase
MTKQLWINLPIKDLNRSKAFFTALGFSLNPRFSNSTDTAGFMVGQTMVMLFAENIFESFTRHTITDTKQSTEVLFSIDAESREEVDELAKKAANAGGTVFAQPGEKDGWMYGCGFSDPDGHRWNVLYMDMSKLPK